MTETEMIEAAARLGAEKAELEPHFDAVRNTQDWKAPIDSLCRREDKDKVARAIEFFTATEATFSEMHPRSEGWVRVEADGYRKGPAGDH
jgi:hypothetical protein